MAYLSVFFIWGSTYLAIRIGVQDIPPALFAGSRFLISGALLLMYGILTRSEFPSKQGIRVSAVVGFFLLVGGNGLVVWSEQWIHSGFAALIIATVPLFMTLIDSFLPRGYKLSLLGWIGILVGLGGVALLVSPGFGETSGNSQQLAGILGLIGASLLWSIGSVYSKHHPASGHIFVITGVQMLAGGSVLALIGVSTGEVSQIHFTSSGLLSLLYLILFGSIIGFTSYAYLLRHVPAAKASTYAYVNPIVAVLLGTIILNEPLDFQTIMAAIVILSGVAIVQIAKSRD